MVGTCHCPGPGALRRHHPALPRGPLAGPGLRWARGGGLVGRALSVAPATGGSRHPSLPAPRRAARCPLSRLRRATRRTQSQSRGPAQPLRARVRIAMARRMPATGAAAGESSTRRAAPRGVKQAGLNLKQQAGRAGPGRLRRICATEFGRWLAVRLGVTASGAGTPASHSPGTPGPGSLRTGPV